MIDAVKSRISALKLCFLAFVLAMLCIPFSSSAATYSDIEGHWAQQTIEKWADRGVISGYPNGQFGPNDKMTKAQLAAVLYKIWGVAPLEDHFVYPDVPEDAWFADALNTMEMYDVVVTEDGLMHPNENLTREEAMYMIGMAFQPGERWESVSGRDVLNRFLDNDQVSARFEGHVAEMIRKGHVSGSSSGKLNPKGLITRAEVLTILNHAVGLYITQPGEYVLDTKEYSSALVTCGDVTIRNAPNVLLVGEAANSGSVTLQRQIDSFFGVMEVHVYSVCEGEPKWTAQDCKPYLRCQISPKTYKFGDTRFSGGRGSLDFPYVITNKEQLSYLKGTHEKRYGGIAYFRLGCDLDLGTLSQPFGRDGKEPDRIVANFNGGGHTITYRMSLNGCNTATAGLFERWDGDVSNLTLAGTVDVVFSDRAAEELYRGQLALGGFAGWMTGRMTNCTSRMEITGRYLGSQEAELQVGGLVGITPAALFSQCAAQGNVKAVMFGEENIVHAGGLLGVSVTYPPPYVWKIAGEGAGGKLIGCQATGSVHAEGGMRITAGGLVGVITCATEDGSVASIRGLEEAALGRIRQSWSTAEVSASGASFQSDCGGIVGHVEASQWIEDCWAKPVVTVNGSIYQNVGGIAGACYNYGKIRNCWADASGCASGGTLHSGGIAGRLTGNITQCYTIGAGHMASKDRLVYDDWNDGTMTSCADLTGSTQTQREEFCRTCGWDFEKTWDYEKGAHPVLRSCAVNPQLAALGT